MALWLNKLLALGGRSNKRSARQPRPALPRMEEVPSTELTLADESLERRKGFDPYNSGTFVRTDAWERLSRR